MNVSRPFTCRRSKMRWLRPCALVMMITMTLMTNGGSHWLMPTVEAQQQVAPVSQGFNITADDLRFIFEQIQVAQFHAAGNPLLGPGPFQVPILSCRAACAPLTARSTTWCRDRKCSAPPT